MDTNEKTVAPTAAEMLLKALKEKKLHLVSDLRAPESESHNYELHNYEIPGIVIL